MKSFNILLVVILVFVGCKTDKNTDAEAETNANATNSEVVADKSAVFGKVITDENAKPATEMAAIFHTMAAADTIATKFSGKVLAVCPSKGCWMRLDLGNGEETMVKFKDYGFFMPKDIAGTNVVVNGMAFVEEMSVDEQQHYAEDAGKSKAEIAQITLPKKTYRFEADGVLLKR